jgi:hypothetical protein
MPIAWTGKRYSTETLIRLRVRLTMSRRCFAQSTLRSIVELSDSVARDSARQQEYPDDP